MHACICLLRCSKDIIWFWFDKFISKNNFLSHTQLYQPKISLSFSRISLQSVVEWSSEKYASVFNSFSDNLAGKSYRERFVTVCTVKEKLYTCVKYRILRVHSLKRNTLWSKFTDKRSKFMDVFCKSMLSWFNMSTILHSVITIKIKQDLQHKEIAAIV